MRTEQVELTVLCLIHKDGSYLLQDRVKNDWKGYTLPGGHIEPGESIVEAVIREMKEETGIVGVSAGAVSKWERDISIDWCYC